MTFIRYLVVSLFSLLLSVSCFAESQQLGSKMRIPEFVGTWKSITPGSDVTKLVIGVKTVVEKTDEGEVKGPHVLGINAFSQCQPHDCEWGNALLVLFGNSNHATDVNAAVAEWSPTYGTTLVTLKQLSTDKLQASFYTTYKDDSGRTNNMATLTFKRVG